MAHVGIVWNPSKTSRDELVDALPESVRASVDWFETTEDDPGRRATHAAIESGADVILAAGGDGTVRAVAHVLAERTEHGESGIELGLLPLGTGNLFARNLAVPIGDLDAAVERALNTRGSPTDLAWAEVTTNRGIERHAFVVIAGFGLDANMIAETDSDLKDRAGWLAYVESLGRAVAASDTIRLTLAIDGEDTRREVAHTLMFGNCGTLQGGLTLLPKADPRDGELDLLVLNAEGIAGWADTLRNMVWDNGLKRLLTNQDDTVDSDSSAHARFTRIECDLERPRVFEVDGDEIGEVSRIVVTVQPGALRVR